MIGYDDFFADGALGLGLWQENDEEAELVEEDTNFVSMLQQTQDEKTIPEKIFG
jgi:hypothetical protein